MQVCAYEYAQNMHKAGLHTSDQLLLMPVREVNIVLSSRDWNWQV